MKRIFVILWGLVLAAVLMIPLVTISGCGGGCKSGWYDTTTSTCASPNAYQRSQEPWRYERAW